MKQNNQSSWAARLRKLTALCLALVATSSAWADDYLAALVKPGETKQLAIQLKNTTDYTAFQMTIKLPAGLEFASSNPALTDRKDASHQLEFNKVDASTMKLAVYSYDSSENKGNEAFNNDKSELLLLDVTVTDENYIAKDIELSDIVFVEKAALTGDALEVVAKGKLGDANGDNNLTPYDATCVLLDNVDRRPANFVEAAADMDCNGSITPYDATLILREQVK